MGCLLPVGREGRRRSMKKRGKKQKNDKKNPQKTKKTRKNCKKICIPVGKADADVKGCRQKGEKQRKNGTGKIRGTAGGLGVGELE
jgi:hypothetical protein